MVVCDTLCAFQAFSDKKIPWSGVVAISNGSGQRNGFAGGGWIAVGVYGVRLSKMLLIYRRMDGR